jgi:hypothetical protein
MPTGTAHPLHNGFVPIMLPLPAGSPLLRTRDPDLAGRTLSVRVHRAGGLDQLPHLLRAQRPSVVVLSSQGQLSARAVQRMTDAAFRYCDNVSVVGAFAGGETFTVRVTGKVRKFFIMDTDPLDPLGSTRTADLIVFGQLDVLELLNIGGDSHVHLTGATSPRLNVCVRARSLTINGARVPTVAHDGGPDRAYIYTSVPQVPQLPVPPPPPPALPPPPPLFVPPVRVC